MFETISQEAAHNDVSRTALEDQGNRLMCNPAREALPEVYSFTESEKDKIRKLHLNRTSLSAMAAQIKRPKHDVKALLSEMGLGIRGGTWSPLHDERLQELAALNLLVPAIAVEMCFTAETIRKHLRVLAVPYNHGPNPRQFWTDARVEQVRQMAEKGSNDKAIAKVFKKKAKQVILVRNQHRIRLKREIALAAWRDKVCVLTPEKEKRLREMAAAGEDDKAISKELSISEKRVKSRRRKLGIRTQKDRPWTSSQIETLRSNWPVGISLAAICAAVEHTPYFVTMKANDLNLQPRRPMRPQKEQQSE